MVYVRLVAACVVLALAAGSCASASDSAADAPVARAVPVVAESQDTRCDSTYTIDPVASASSSPIPSRVVVVGGDQTAESPTLNYAAEELVTHLRLVGIPAERVDSDHDGLSSIVLVSATDSAYETAQALVDAVGQPPASGYVIDQHSNDIVIVGDGDVGTLHGTYAFLDRLGFAWYDPYETHTPDLTRTSRVQWRRVVEEPVVARRGFWMWNREGFHPEEFAVWMSRNRLNLAGGFRPEVAQKLGIMQSSGGHHLMREAFGDPELQVSHPEWFPVVNGVQRSVADGFNPRFAAPGAADHFADYLISELADGALVGTDVLNLWPADSRSLSVWDQSPESLTIGNPTDNLLAFYVAVGDRLAEASSRGVIKPVTLGGISYYVNWEPPTNTAVVQRLEEQDYLHLFYTNERSWMHELETSGPLSDDNERIIDGFDAWNAATDFPSGVVEYHNYSIYAGVVVDDLEHLGANYSYLTSAREDAYAYMHPLLQNPGPRRLSNVAMAQLGWHQLDCNTDIGRFAQTRTEYFADRYGTYSQEWHDVYRVMSQSTQNAREMFGLNSLTTVLLGVAFWANPRLDKSDVFETAQLYVTGGTNVTLPTTADDRGQISATFRGLEESLALQTQASEAWRRILESVEDPLIRARMLDDVEWFEATAARYQLLQLTIDYYEATLEGSCILIDCGSDELRTEIEATVQFLQTTAVTEDTLSPVNQRSTFAHYLRMIDRLSSDN